MIKSKLNKKLTYGTSVDIWSFGVFAVELATGNPINFQIELEKDLYHAILRTPQPAIDLETNGCSPEYNSFVNACLIVDDSKRLKSSELLKHTFL